MRSFILFRRNHDPLGQTPVGVYDFRDTAERSELYQQQQLANRHNSARESAYLLGSQFSAETTAADYKNEFYIEEVTTP